MNRRTFLTVPLIVLPVAACRKAQASATWNIYPYWLTPDLDMHFFTTNDDFFTTSDGRCGMHTIYKKPDPTRCHPGVGAEIDWFTDPRDIQWARDFYPEVFAALR